jgi:hypothetical protein
MIRPLCKDALTAGANSNWLNPKNGGQGRISIYLGKPIRAIARVVYGIACITIVPVIGLFYHTGQAIKNTFISGQQVRAWSHLKAAGQDAYIFTASLFFISGASLEFSLARRLATSERAKSIYLFSMSFATFAMGSFIPLMFSHIPNRFRV